jgi:hypothetical protein
LEYLKDSHVKDSINYPLTLGMVRFVNRHLHHKNEALCSNYKYLLVLQEHICPSLWEERLIPPSRDAVEKIIEGGHWTLFKEPLKF